MRNAIRIDTYSMTRSEYRRAQREQRFNNAIDFVPGILSGLAFLIGCFMWAAGII